MTRNTPIALIAALLFTSACASVADKAEQAPQFAVNLPLAPTVSDLRPEAVIMAEPLPLTAPVFTPAPDIPAPAPVIIAEMPPAEVRPLPPEPEVQPIRPASKPVLTVRLTGLKTIKGVVSAALYDEAGYKAKDGVPHAAQNISVTSEALSFTFDDIAAGEYGLKLYHDVNENGKLDTNFIGIPTEPYAFSNSALNPFGEAKWKNAKFIVGEDGAVQVIEFK